MVIQTNITQDVSLILYFFLRKLSYKWFRQRLNHKWLHVYMHTHMQMHAHLHMQCMCAYIHVDMYFFVSCA